MDSLKTVLIHKNDSEFAQLRDFMTERTRPIEHMLELVLVQMNGLRGFMELEFQGMKSESSKIVSRILQLETQSRELNESTRDLPESVKTLLKVKSSMDDIESKLSEQRNLLEAIVHGDHQFPRLMVVIPVMAKGWQRVNPMRWITNKSRVFFLCSFTKELAVCGPEGRGYEIVVTKRAVREAMKNALPFLKVSLTVLSLSVKLFTGLSIDTSVVSDLLGDNSLQDLLEASAASLDSLSSAAAAAPDADGRLDDASSAFKAMEDISSDAARETVIRDVEASIGNMNARTVRESVQTLLGDVDPTLAHVGLILAVSRSGLPEWVLQLKEVVDCFEAGRPIDDQLRRIIKEFRRQTKQEQEAHGFSLRGMISNTTKNFTSRFMK